MARRSRQAFDRDALGEVLLHRSMRLERCDELGIEALELFALLIEENDALGGKAVLQCVTAGDGPPGWGPWSGAAERIAAIGFDLQKTGHLAWPY